MQDNYSERPPKTGPKDPVSGDRSHWNEPKPETLPRPTYWPATLAFAATITAFGVVTSLLLSGLGMVLFAFAISMWIGEIRHERNN
jgi:hypothetical protein